MGISKPVLKYKLWAHKRAAQYCKAHLDLIKFHREQLKHGDLDALEARDSQTRMSASDVLKMTAAGGGLGFLVTSATAGFLHLASKANEERPFAEFADFPLEQVASAGLWGGAMIGAAVTLPELVRYYRERARNKPVLDLLKKGRKGLTRAKYHYQSGDERLRIEANDKKIDAWLEKVGKKLERHKKKITELEGKLRNNK